MRNIVLSFLLYLFAMTTVAKRVEPYSGSRIFWDMTSRVKIFDGGLYGRMLQLKSGKLIATTMVADQIYTSFSDNKGGSWSSQIVPFKSAAGWHNYDPELYQMNNGKLLIAYNIGPEGPEDNVHNYGVRMRMSNDEGVTWGDEIFVYDAGYTFHTGCWEPVFLELPSGELQIYFSDESPYLYNLDQCIQLTRSFDGGYTWSNVETISYRPGSRDGMPTPVIVNDSIVVTIEDNGWPGESGFVPVTLRCPLETNWHGVTIGPQSEWRAQALDYSWCAKAYGGAPYMRVLPNGETVLSRHSSMKSGTNELLNQYVYIGDTNARNFKAMSQPYPDNMTSRISVMWGSISLLDTVVCAIGGIGDNFDILSSRHVDIIKGYPKQRFVAYQATPVVDGVIGTTEYNTKTAGQITMGNVIGSRTFADFDYNEDSLYFVARVNDKTPISDRLQMDAVRLLLDVDDVSDDTPVKGMFNFFFQTDSTFKCWQGDNGKWTTYNDTTGVNYKVSVNSSYYIIEAAIPWSMLGQSGAPLGRRMGMAIEIQDRRDTAMPIETMPDVKKDQSFTWMEFRLNGNLANNITQPLSQGQLKFVSNTLYLPSEINHYYVYSLKGNEVANGNVTGKTLNLNFLSKGVYIVKVLLDNNQTLSTKVLIK